MIYVTPASCEIKLGQNKHMTKIGMCGVKIYLFEIKEYVIYITIEKQLFLTKFVD